MRIYIVAFLVSLLIGALGYLVATSMWSKRTEGSESLSRLTQIRNWEQEGAPDFETASGVRLSQLNSPIKVVHFWASWCGPCIEEIPSLQELARKLGDRVTILALSQDSSEEEMQAFLREHKVASIPNLQFIFDQKPKVSAAYKADKLPESYILNSQNQLKKKVSGSIEWVTPESLSYFESLVSSASQ